MVGGGGFAAAAVRVAGTSRPIRMETNVLKKLICGAAVAALLPFAARADGTQAGESVPASENVVVSATLTPTDLSKVGASVSVLTAADIRQQQTVFATDILQTVPGVVVTQEGPRGTTSSVQMRGAPGYDTYVLIDGVEVADPSGPQTAFDFSQLTVEGVDRIEVLRGSQSVLYGGDAVGGVVDIMTRRGAGGFDGLLYAEGGSFDTYLVGGHAAGGLDGDRFGYNATLQYFGDNGFSAADSNLPGNSEKDGYHNLSTNGRLDYALNDAVDVKFVWRYAGGRDNTDACGGPYCDESNYGDRFTQYSTRLSSDFRLWNGFFTGEAGAAFSHDGRTNFDNGGSDYFYRGDREKYDFKGVLNFDPDNILVFGAESKRDFSRTDADAKTQSIRNNGFYAEYQATPIEPLTVTLGTRLDDNQRFGDYATWRATAAYALDATGTGFKASYATGFRAPSLFELYGACCGDPDLGNPALQPEKSRSWDIGVTQKLLSDRLTAGVTYFRLDTYNAIEYGGDFGTPAPNYFNVPGTTQSQGVETDVRWTPVEALALTLAYTHDDVHDATGTRLTERPRDVLNLNANYAFLDDRANLNLNLRYTSDTLSDDFSTYPTSLVNLGSYAVADLAGSYRLFDRTTLYGRLENIADQKYETEFGYGTAGRSFFLGIRQGI